MKEARYSRQVQSCIVFVILDRIHESGGFQVNVWGYSVTKVQETFDARLKSRMAVYVMLDKIQHGEGS